SGLFEDTGDLNVFLQRTVGMIAEHMHCDVCSIYLYYYDKKEVVLMATKGLNEKFVGNIRLKVGEGLTGLALKELRPIVERNASQNPSFRYFPGLGEEKYESFLAVPIIRGKRKIGVMVIQNTKRNFFSEQDVNALRAISSQLANTIEITRIILSMEKQPSKKTVEEKPKDLTFVAGKVGSSGVAFGEAFVLKSDQNFVSEKELKTKSKYTLKQFRKALEKTEEQLENVQKQVEEALSDVASLIFSAQILMLKDQGFVTAIEELIKKDVNPPEAIIKIVQRYCKRFESIEDAYIREKSHDVMDIGRRLLDNLTGKKSKSFNLSEKVIIARELFPSDALKFSSMKVGGIILLSGGVTSHLSILSRSLQLPLIIADEPALLDLPPGTKILMNGEQGDIYINPSKDILTNFPDK
ncbi:MAG: GAF domain-containing protein, partial [Candidatus Omnitrophica bacterium]|nr:GAF domain-containing protein [Candidatus Omnitrophota bacterium]